MKYKCEVIRDLMPLCADDSAAEGSKKAVFEHISKCAECEKYYKDIIKQIHLDEKITDADTSEYTVIANRYRRRNRRRRIVAIIAFGIVFLLMLNYALGYRVTALAAAQRSGRLNPTSQLMAEYEWNDVRFFFYRSDANYDTIASVRHWNGWRSDDFYFVWPRYPMDDGKIIVTSSIYYFENDQGILILPILCEDEAIARVTITAFGKTKSADLETGRLSVLAFENDDLSLEDVRTGYAYDIHGNIKYELQYDEPMGRWTWVEK